MTPIDLRCAIKDGQRYRVTLVPVELELKPCPFCGGEARAETSPKGNIYWVSCASCGARGLVKDWKGARDAWNRRYSPGYHDVEEYYD